VRSNNKVIYRSENWRLNREELEDELARTEVSDKTEVMAEHLKRETKGAIELNLAIYLLGSVANHDRLASYISAKASKSTHEFAKENLTLFLPYERGDVQKILGQ